MAHSAGRGAKTESRARFLLSHQTTSALQEILQDEWNRHRRLLFPFPWSEKQMWARLRDILHRAGLPLTRGDLYHKFRRTTASHIAAAAGIDAAARQLGHSGTTVTQRVHRPAHCPRQRRWRRAPAPAGRAPGLVENRSTPARQTLPAGPTAIGADPMFPLRFDRARAVNIIEAIGDGRPLWPATPDGWSPDDLLTVAAACVALLRGLGPIELQRKHDWDSAAVEAALASIHEEHRDAIVIAANADLLAAVDFAASLTQIGRCEVYNQFFDPIVTAKISETLDGREITAIGGFRSKGG